jgi:hypothetical protein
LPKVRTPCPSGRLRVCIYYIHIHTHLLDGVLSRRRPISDIHEQAGKEKPWERRKFGGQSGHLPPWAKQANSLRRPASVQGSSSKIQRAFGPSAKLHGPWDGTREIALAAMTTRCICRGGRPLNRLSRNPSRHEQARQDGTDAIVVAVRCWARCCVRWMLGRGTN